MAAVMCPSSAPHGGYYFPLPIQGAAKFLQFNYYSILTLETRKQSLGRHFMIMQISFPSSKISPLGIAFISNSGLVQCLLNLLTNDVSLIQASLTWSLANSQQSVVSKPFYLHMYVFDAYMGACVGLCVCRCMSRYGYRCTCGRVCICICVRQQKSALGFHSSGAVYFVLG